MEGFVKDLYALIISIFYIPLTILAFVSTIKSAISPPKDEKLGRWPKVLQYLYFIGGFYSVLCTASAFGRFGRGEDPALPWAIFAKYSSIGTVDAYIQALALIIGELWLIWIPAHIYAIHFSGGDRTKVRMARIINLLAGLLSFVHGNLLYKFANIIFTLVGSHSD